MRYLLSKYMLNDSIWIKSYMVILDTYEGMILNFETGPLYTLNLHNQTSPKQTKSKINKKNSN